MPSCTLSKNTLGNESANNSSQVEFQEHGFTPEEAGLLVGLLDQHRFDFIELSGGTYAQLAWEHKNESTRKREAFFIEFAEIIAPHKKHARLYITGGLRTTKGMVGAIEETAGLDGVGLGRPNTNEPRLPLGILDGSIKSCLRPLQIESDVPMGNLLGLTQMWQMGQGHEPLNPANQDDFNDFLAGIAWWQGKLTTNVDGTFYGPPQIHSKRSTPYGVTRES